MESDRLAATRRLEILAICGSLRIGSFNRALLQVATEVAPPELQIHEFRLDRIPLFNADLSRPGPPASVVAFNAAIDAADALLIATPEYNRSMPGVLKNALDWASRPHLFSVLRGKPIAVIGASTGGGGTLTAQADLRRVLRASGACPLTAPALGLARVQTMFVNGALNDAKTKHALREVLMALAAEALPRRSPNFHPRAPAITAVTNELRRPRPLRSANQLQVESATPQA